MFERLPDDTIDHIFNYGNILDLLILSKRSELFYNLANRSYRWRQEKWLRYILTIANGYNCYSCHFSREKPKIAKNRSLHFYYINTQLHVFINHNATSKENLNLSAILNKETKYYLELKESLILNKETKYYLELKESLWDCCNLNKLVQIELKKC